MTHPPFATARVFGIEFVSQNSISEIAHHLVHDRSTLCSGGPALIVTPNVDQLVKLKRSPSDQLHATFHDCYLALPDGQPVVWASKTLGAPLRERLTGSSLVAELWPQIVANEIPAIVVASSDVVGELIRTEAPHVSVIVAPMLDEGDDAAMALFGGQISALAKSSRAEFVFICVSFPKENLIARYAMSCYDPTDHGPIFLAIGASFDMYYGLKRRAPIWIPRIGMEWAFRFVQEPRRLFRRYFIDDVGFVKLVISERRSRDDKSESVSV